MDNKNSNRLQHFLRKVLLWYLVAIAIIGNVSEAYTEGSKYIKLFTYPFFWVSLIVVVGLVFLLYTLIGRRTKKNALIAGVLTFFVFWCMPGLGSFVSNIAFVFLVLAALYFVIHLKNDYEADKGKKEEESTTKGD